MKILFLEAVQNYGGARKSTVELAGRLQRDGKKIKIVDFWGTCSPFVQAMEENQIDYEIIDRRKEPFILSDSNKLKMILNYIIYIGVLINYRKKIKNIIINFKPDLIIVNNVKTLSILPKSNKFNIGYFAREWFLPTTISSFNKFLIKRNVDFFIGVSHATRAAIYAGGFSKLKNIYVVQNAIDYNKIEEIKLKDECLNWQNSINRPMYIFHCGGFLPSKGQDIMIDIAKELRKRQVNFHIKLAGIVYKGGQSEKFLNKIQLKIEKDSLQDYFTLIVNEPNVLSEFSSVDILVHPSSTEGLPRVVMEAMAFGKPVIGNPVGGMFDYILDGYNGYIANFNSVNDYCDILEQLYNDKDLYTFVSSNAQSLIKNNFSESNQMKQFSKLTNNYS